MLFHSSKEAYVSLFLLEAGDIYSPLGRDTFPQTASGGRYAPIFSLFNPLFHLPMHIMSLRLHIVFFIFDREVD